MTKILINEAKVRGWLDTFVEINKLSVGENAICLPAEIDTAMDEMHQALADAALDKMAENARELGLSYEQPAVKTYCGGKPNYCIPEQPAPAQDPDPDELAIAYMSGLHEGKKAERKRILNLLMIQHESAKGAHNYWKVAANLIQAEVASDT